MIFCIGTPSFFYVTCEPRNMSKLPLNHQMVYPTDVNTNYHNLLLTQVNHIRVIEHRHGAASRGRWHKILKGHPLYKYIPTSGLKELLQEGVIPVGRVDLS